MFLFAGGARSLRGDEGLGSRPVDLGMNGVGESGKDGVCKFWDDDPDDEAIVISQHAGAFVAELVDCGQNSISSVV